MCALSCVLSLPLAVGCDGRTPAPSCGPDDDVPDVTNAGPGVWRTDGRTAALVEQWRAGGLTEGQDLAAPVGVAASPDGRIAIPDFQLGDVIVIGADGAWDGAWGRQGRGPGEVGTPVAATWDAGGTLVVFDILAPKAVFLQRTGPRQDDLRMEPAFTGPAVRSGQVLWAGIQPDGSGLLEVPLDRAQSSDGTSRTAFLRLPPGATSADTLAIGTMHSLRDPALQGLTVPGSPHPSASVAPDGEIAIGGLGPSYLVTVFDAAGEATRHICRDVPPLPFAERERHPPEDAPLPQRLLDALAAAPQPDSLAAFGTLFLGARGRLWVGRDRPGPFTKGAVPGGAWDVFDERGRYLGEVRAPGGVRLQAAIGDTVFGFITGNMDETAVVAYRLELGPG